MPTKTSKRASPVATDRSGQPPLEEDLDDVTEGSAASTTGLSTRYVDPGPVGAVGPVMPEGSSAPAGSDREQPPPGTRRGRSGRDQWLLRVGMVASTVGLCVLLFGVYVYGFSTLQEHRDQRRLLNEFTLPSRVQILSGGVPPEGRPAGLLTIGAIGLRQVVVQGTSATDLLEGPGRRPGTARPGSLGNAVIAGHRTIAGSPFAGLDRLRAGDVVDVVTDVGAYRYRVTGIGIARPGGVDPTSPTRHPTLTLVTSAGRDRLFVRAALVSRPNRDRVPRRPPTLAQRGVSGDPAAVLPSVLWGLVLLAGFAATFAAYWRLRGRQWSVYLLSTPVLLAVAFLWYENLIRLLPGTM
jgi:sortase A